MNPLLQAVVAAGALSSVGLRVEEPVGLWQRFCDALRAQLGPPLRALHAPLDAWLESLPMWVAQAAALSLFVVTGVWVWTLSRDFVYLGAADRAAWRDLRIWATLLLIPYIAVYVFLGR